jgi:hypothetical protein
MELINAQFRAGAQVKTKEGTGVIDMVCFTDGLPWYLVKVKTKTGIDKLVPVDEPDIRLISEDEPTAVNGVGI